jgi:predicted Rossmann fold nucleotide-binding protein DprA/Smf involved in DNA uptake
MSELAMAMYAASRDAHSTDRDRTTRSFSAFAAAFDEKVELRRLADAGFRWVGRSDAAFPSRLRSIHDPPPGLFLRGFSSAELLARPAVAIVGARACSDYGAHVARSLARELAAAGVVVVSGLARGSMAGRTAAVSRHEVKRSRCSAAGSIATIRAHMPDSPAR